MFYLLLGLAALVIWLSIAKAFTRANPAVMARQMRLLGGGLLLAFAVLFALRGLEAIAAPLAAVGSWLIWGPTGSLPRGWGGGSRGTSGGGAAGSRVVTDHLDVSLDHGTGALEGRVLKGMFKGRRVETLKPVELALLWQDCRFTDPQSAQIVEAWLDRTHPTWREDLARGEREMGSGPNGRMGREEAYEILGLKPGAGEDDIRRAHRELMMKLHPDRGGSTYLAAKINEAKDVLLGRA